MSRANPSLARRARAKPDVEQCGNGRPPRAMRLHGAPLRGSAVEIVVASPLWNARRGVRTVLRRAIAEAAYAASKAVGEVTVVLTDDPAIQKLNRDWRSKNRPTNVLSFPAIIHPAAALEWTVPTPNAVPGPLPLGDIVIAYETTKREALAARKPFAHHLAHLAVHGYLHLVGYDHQADRDAETMEAMETTILARLKMPDPYARTTPKSENDL
jgi:probable rRNA maturation factor